METKPQSLKVNGSKSTTLTDHSKYHHKEDEKTDNSNQGVMLFSELRRKLSSLPCLRGLPTLLVSTSASALNQAMCVKLQQRVQGLDYFEPVLKRLQPGCIPFVATLTVVWDNDDETPTTDVHSILLTHSGLARPSCIFHGTWIGYAVNKHTAKEMAVALFASGCQPDNLEAHSYVARTGELFNQDCDNFIGKLHTFCLDNSHFARSSFERAVRVAHATACTWRVVVRIQYRWNINDKFEDKAFVGNNSQAQAARQNAAQEAFVFLSTFFSTHPNTFHRVVASTTQLPYVGPQSGPFPLLVRATDYDANVPKKPTPTTNSNGYSFQHVAEEKTSDVGDNDINPTANANFGLSNLETALDSAEVETQQLPVCLPSQTNLGGSWPSPFVGAPLPVSNAAVWPLSIPYGYGPYSVPTQWVVPADPSLYNPWNAPGCGYSSANMDAHFFAGGDYSKAFQPRPSTNTATGSTVHSVCSSEIGSESEWIDSEVASQAQNSSQDTSFNASSSPSLNTNTNTNEHFGSSTQFKHSPGQFTVHSKLPHASAKAIASNVESKTVPSSDTNIQPTVDDKHNGHSRSPARSSTSKRNIVSRRRRCSFATLFESVELIPEWGRANDPFLSMADRQSAALAFCNLFCVALPTMSVSQLTPNMKSSSGKPTSTSKFPFTCTVEHPLLQGDEESQLDMVWDKTADRARDRGWFLFFRQGLSKIFNRLGRIRTGTSSISMQWKTIQDIAGQTEIVVSSELERLQQWVESCMTACTRFVVHLCIRHLSKTRRFSAVPTVLYTLEIATDTSLFVYQFPDESDSEHTFLTQLQHVQGALNKLVVSKSHELILWSHISLDTLPSLRDAVNTVFPAESSPAVCGVDTWLSKHGFAPLASLPSLFGLLTKRDDLLQGSRLCGCICAASRRSRVVAAQRMFWPTSPRIQEHHLFTVAILFRSLSIISPATTPKSDDVSTSFSSSSLS